MFKLKSIAFACAAILLVSCAPTDNVSESAAPTVDLAAMKQKWEGTWKGSWGGSCTGSIEVSSVDADSAYVTYSWGICGGSSPGSYVDRAASIDDGTLTVHLRGRTRAHYTHVDPDTLEGRYDRPGDGANATGIFKRNAP